MTAAPREGLCQTAPECFGHFRVGFPYKTTLPFWGFPNRRDFGRYENGPRSIQSQHPAYPP